MSSDMFPAPDHLESRIAALEAQNAAPQEALATVCRAFCGHTDRRGGRPETMAAMAAHVAQCPKHPLRLAGAENVLPRHLLAELAHAAETLCQAWDDPDFPDCAYQVREVIGRVRAAGVEVP